MSERYASKTSYLLDLQAMPPPSGKDLRKFEAKRNLEFVKQAGILVLEAISLIALYGAKT